MCYNPCDMTRAETARRGERGMEPFTHKEDLRRTTPYLLEVVRKQKIADEAWDRATTDAERTKAWAASTEAHMQLTMVGRYLQLVWHLKRVSRPQKLGEPFIPSWMKQYAYGITVTEPDDDSSCFVLQANGAIRRIQFLDEEQEGNRIAEVKERLTGREYMIEAHYVANQVEKLNQLEPE